MRRTQNEAFPGRPANLVDLPASVLFRISRRPVTVHDGLWIAIATAPTGEIFTLFCDQVLHDIIMESLAERREIILVREGREIVPTNEDSVFGNVTNDVPIPAAA